MSAAYAVYHLPFNTGSISEPERPEVNQDVHSPLVIVHACNPAPRRGRQEGQFKSSFPFFELVTSLDYVRPRSPSPQNVYLLSTVLKILLSWANGYI